MAFILYLQYITFILHGNIYKRYFEDGLFKIICSYNDCHACNYQTVSDSYMYCYYPLSDYYIIVRDSKGQLLFTDLINQQISGELLKIFHNKASNLAIRIEFGALPLIFRIYKLLLYRYYFRLQKIVSNQENSNLLLKHAYLEGEKKLQEMEKLVGKTVGLYEEFLII